MKCCPKVLTDNWFVLKRIPLFIYSFGDKFLKKMFSFLKQYFKILASFLSVEDNTKDMRNEATLNR